MRANDRPKPPTSSRRARLLALATIVSIPLIAGCGGSSHTPTTASRAGASQPIAGTGGGVTKPSTIEAAFGRPSGLAFAKCMRASGVPNFPDPSPGRGLVFNANGIDMNAPAFLAAQSKCKKLLPAGGPPGPGSQTHPSEQTLTKLRNIARCMRQHGIADFPDPRTSVPSNTFGGGPGEITDFDGVILLFPGTMNLQAPAYRQALTACGAPPLGLPH